MSAAAAPAPAGGRSVRALPGWFVLAAGLLLLAAAVAFAWWALVPEIPVVEVDGVVASAGPGDDVLASADGAFALLSLVAGALAGIGVLVLGRERVLGASSWGVVGGLGAAVVAWQLGRLMGPASLSSQREAGVDPLLAPLDLSVPFGQVLLWPGATATVVFAGLLVWLLVRPPQPGA